MKKFLFGITIILAQVACIVNLSSCQEFNIDSQQEFPAKIEIDAQTEYNVLAMAPADIVFNISSNTPWKITSDQNWCIPSPGMSASSSLIEAITVHLENNENLSARQATLTIKADDIEGSTSITIVQDSKGSLHVQPVDNAFQTTGGTATFTITSNKAWTVISDNQWLTFDKAEGTGTGNIETITATATANPGAKRTTIVTVSTGLEKKTFEATQDGVILEFAEVEEGATTFSGAGQTEAKIYTVVANIPWKVETKDEWITIEKIDEESFSVKVLNPNSYFVTRTADITLKPESGTVSGLEIKPLTIRQNVYFQNDNLGASTITVNDNGSITLASINKNKCRLYTPSTHKLGIYIWTFSQVHFTDPAFFDINFYNEQGGPRFELFLGTANPSFQNKLGAWPGDWWDEKTFDLSLDELNAMKTLKIEFTHDPDNTSNLKLTIWLNDRQLTSISKPDFYANPATDFGNQIYFGFNGHCADAEVTMESFEIKPIN